jgi:hypothetical protein
MPKSGSRIGGYLVEKSQLSCAWFNSLFTRGHSLNNLGVHIVRLLSTAKPLVIPADTPHKICRFSTVTSLLMHPIHRTNKGNYVSFLLNLLLINTAGISTRSQA